MRNFNPFIFVVMAGALIGAKCEITSAEVVDITDPKHPIEMRTTLCGSNEMFTKSSLKKKLGLCIKTVQSMINSDDVNYGNGGIINAFDSQFSPNTKYLLLSSAQPPTELKPIAGNGSLSEEDSTPKFKLPESINPKLKLERATFFVSGKNLNDCVDWHASVAVVAPGNETPQAFKGRSRRMLKAFNVKGISDVFWIGSSTEAKYDGDGYGVSSSDAEVFNCEKPTTSCTPFLSENSLKNNCVTDIKSLLGSFSIHDPSENEEWLVFDAASCRDGGEPTYVWIRFIEGKRADHETLGMLVYASEH